MEKAKWSLFKLKDEILNGNRILFSESDIKVILQQIIQAYAILKKERLCHSDVHPGNILIGFDSKVRLCDFEFSYQYNKEIEKTNEPLILPDPNKFEEFLAPELFFWARKLSDKYESIRYDPFKSDIFSVGLCILFLGHFDFKDKFDMKGFNDYTIDISDKEERKKINSRILKLLKLGTREYKLNFPWEYKEYMVYASRLQEKIKKKIKSLKFRSIRKILWKMLKVHFPDREDIEKLLCRIKLKTFDVIRN